MIEAYFDESGIHDDAEVCIVAGYFGHSAQWKVFKEKWLAVLRRFDFRLQEFHAVDLVRSHKFHPMLEQLVLSISTSEIYPISSGIIRADFFSFSEPQRQFLTGGRLKSQTGKLVTSGSRDKPYFVPFQHVVRNTTDYIGRGQKANFFFGTDHPTSKYALPLMEDLRKRSDLSDVRESFREKIGSVQFPLAKETPQLQAADLFCHLSFLHMTERHKHRNWNVPPSPLLASCLQKARSSDDHSYQTRDTLNDVIERTRSLSGQWDDK